MQGKIRVAEQKRQGAEKKIQTTERGSELEGLHQRPFASQSAAASSASTGAAAEDSYDYPAAIGYMQDQLARLGSLVARSRSRDFSYQFSQIAHVVAQTGAQQNAHIQFLQVDNSRQSEYIAYLEQIRAHQSHVISSLQGQLHYLSSVVPPALPPAASAALSAPARPDSFAEGEITPDHIQLLIERGSNLKDEGLCQKAFDMAVTLKNEDLQARALIELGECGNTEAWNRALTIGRRTSNPLIQARAWILRGNQLYHSKERDWRKNSRKACETFEEAIALLKLDSPDQSIQFFRACHGIALAYLKLNKIKAAECYFDKTKTLKLPRYYEGQRNRLRFRINQLQGKKQVSLSTQEHLFVSPKKDSQQPSQEKVSSAQQRSTDSSVAEAGQSAPAKSDFFEGDVFPNTDIEDPA